jgi:hypothetical protein
MKIITITVGTLFLFALVSPVSATNLNLSHELGETSIKWTWYEPTYPLYMIYVDTQFIKNTTTQYYYLNGQDVKSMEQHRIDIYLYNPAKAAGSGGTLDSPEEIADLQATMTSTTTMNIEIYILLMVILVICTIITGLIQNPVRGFLIGLLSIILAITLSLLSAFFMDFLTLLSIIIGFLAVIFTVLHAQAIMKNSYISFNWS